MKLLLCLLLLLGSCCSLVVGGCRCGIEAGVKRIVGGQVSRPQRYPWMAGIVIRDHTLCGGSLINDRFILTAAHCLAGLSLDDVRVILGAHDISQETSLPTVPVADFVFLDYDPETATNDIALIKLASPVDISFYTPICLSEASGIAADVFVTGWGLTNAKSRGGTMSSQLKEAQLIPLSDRRCGREWYAYDRNRQMCAGESGNAACQGDSGGPLSTRVGDQVTQIGVVSFGDADCGVGTNVPSIFTRVSPYVTQIRSVVQFADKNDGVSSRWCN